LDESLLASVNNFTDRAATAVYHPFPDFSIIARQGNHRRQKLEHWLQREGNAGRSAVSSPVFVTKDQK
jgi:hypothetical protein